MSYPPQPLPSFPVYIVISKREQSYFAAIMQRYGLPHHILRVIRCDVVEIEDAMQAVVNPMYAAIPGLQVAIYTRPADTKLFDEWQAQEMAEIRELSRDAGWLPGDDEAPHESTDS